MFHELCRCRQVACTDPETEDRRRQFLHALRCVSQPQPVNRIRWVMTATTATSTTSTWRYEP